MSIIVKMAKRKNNNSNNNSNNNNNKNSDNSKKRKVQNPSEKCKNKNCGRPVKSWQTTCPANRGCRENEFYCKLCGDDMRPLYKYFVGWTQCNVGTGCKREEEKKVKLAHNNIYPYFNYQFE